MKIQAHSGAKKLSLMAFAVISVGTLLTAEPPRRGDNAETNPSRQKHLCLSVFIYGFSLAPRAEGEFITAVKIGKQPCP
jgi:hypothetical protein